MSAFTNKKNIGSEQVTRLAKLLDITVDGVRKLRVLTWRKKGIYRWYRVYWQKEVGEKTSLKSLANSLQCIPAMAVARAIKRPDDAPWGRLTSLCNCTNVLKGEQYYLRGKNNTIGRAPTSQVYNSACTVSNLHCNISEDGDCCYIEDLSKNGTWLNGYRLTTNTTGRLYPGIIISLTDKYRFGRLGVAAFVFSHMKGPLHFFHKYQLGNKIGHGTFAVVHECVHRETGERFAVKIIDTNVPRGWNSNHVKTKVLREIEIQESIHDHPNIVHILEHFVERSAGSVFIVMEHARGGNLYQRLRTVGHYTESDARKIMEQLLSTVKYMHEKSVTHRDLKPANILLGGDLEVKIADFSESTLTVAGMTAYTGSPIYFAPEVLRQKMLDKTPPYNCLADMWSLGVIMFNVLCARNPWKQQDLETQLENTPYNIDIRTPWPSISDNAKDLLRKMLSPADNRCSADDALRHPWFHQKKRKR